MSPPLTFDDFLGALKSRKRKQLRKERAKARAAIERLTWVERPTLEQLDDLDRFYRITTENHGGRDYLRPGFFHALAKHLPEAMRLVDHYRFRAAMKTAVASPPFSVAPGDGSPASAADAGASAAGVSAHGGRSGSHS